MAAARDLSQPNGIVRICLVSDPDLPADITQRLCADLPAALRSRVTGDVDWRVRRHVASLEADEQLSVSDLPGAFERSVADDDWDVSLFITDLPRRSGVRPVAAEVAPDARIGLLSLPAMGPFRLYHRTKEAVLRLIAELMLNEHQRSSHDERRRASSGTKHGRLARISIEPLRADPAAPQGVRLTTTRALGSLRMVGGMMRANRPWRLFLGLSRSLAGVFATAAYALINVTAWRLGIFLGAARQSALAVLAVAVLVGWLVIDHELWETASDRHAARRARLYNLATVLTLGLGVVCLYAAVFCGLLIVEQLLLRPTIVQQGIGVNPGWSDDLAIAWFGTSAAMIGGALGSGFEDDGVVRRATYGARQRERNSQSNGEHDPAGDDR